jgi:hypothetical protein
VDILSGVLGGFTDEHMSALFGKNLAATEGEIKEAMRDAQVYGEATNELIQRVGLVRGLYARDQPLFGPLVRLMSLAGWTVSGSGFFSVAFYKGGLAIKISLRGSGDAALDYLKWARDNDHLPGVPMLYALGEHSHSYVALMERYTPITSELNPDSADFCDHLSCEFSEVRDAMYGETDVPCWPAGMTAKVIRKHFGPKAAFDMHKGNVMLSRDGKLVITDPLGRSRDRSTRYGGYSQGYTYTYDYSQAA